MADSPNLRALARDLAMLKWRQDRQEQASNSEQMKYSSLDDGSVVEKDATGSIVSRWGRQHDGTHGTAILNGPTPPVPTPPTVDGTAGTLTVTWDGAFPGDRRVPLDFQTVQIGVGSPDGDLSMVGVITSEAGGSKTLSIDPGDYDVALRSRAASGRMSAWSTPARATVEPIIDPEVIARLEGAFTTSQDAPTPADGEGKPEGAYWTQNDAEGAQIARWRWVDGTWVDAPISVEFIPEAYVDFLAANEAFIADMRSEIVTSDVFQGREFIGGTFTGTRFEGAEIEGAEITGGTLDIPGALTASLGEGVAIGGGLEIYQDPTWQTFTGGVRDANLMDWTPFPTGFDHHEDIVIRVKVERTSSYRYSGRLSAWTRNQAGAAGRGIRLDEVSLRGEGEVRELRFMRPGTAPWRDEIQVRYTRDAQNSELGIPLGNIDFSDLEVVQPSTGSVAVSGDVTANTGVFNRVQANELRAERVTSPWVNTFPIVAEMEASLEDAPDGTTATTLDPPMTWRMDAGVWVPAPGNWKLDETDLTGTVGTGTTLHIPEPAQGLFYRYLIDVVAGVEGADTRPLVVYVNSGAEPAYRVSSEASHAGTIYDSQNTQETSFPRTGYIGRWASTVHAQFTPANLGDTRRVNWHTTGWGDSAGDGLFSVSGGGRWLVDEPRTLTGFTIRTSSSTDVWNTSSDTLIPHARLWGIR